MQVECRSRGICSEAVSSARPAASEPQCPRRGGDEDKGPSDSSATFPRIPGLFQRPPVLTLPDGGDRQWRHHAHAERRATICPSRISSASVPKKQIHITTTPSVHVIVPAIARPPKVSKARPGRATAATEYLTDFRRNCATPLLRPGPPANNCARNPVPMNPTDAPANRPLMSLLYPPDSETARYPCKTTMAAPPPASSAEKVTQSFIGLPERSIQLLQIGWSVSSFRSMSLFSRLRRSVNAR